MRYDIRSRIGKSDISSFFYDFWLFTRNEQADLFSKTEPTLAQPDPNFENLKTPEKYFGFWLGRIGYRKGLGRIFFFIFGQPAHIYCLPICDPCSSQTLAIQKVYVTFIAGSWFPVSINF